MTDPKKTAAVALAKCAAYDPWFPNPSAGIVEAWAEQIGRYDLEPDDVLAAVTKMYSANGSGFRPLPKDLTDAAREIRRDRAERESTAARQAREDRLDASLESRNRLADMVGGVADRRSLTRALRGDQ